MTQYEKHFSLEDQPNEEVFDESPREDEAEAASSVVNANVNGYLDRVVNDMTAWEDEIIEPSERYKGDSAEVRLARIEMIRLMKQRLLGDLQSAKEVLNEQAPR